MKECGNLPRFEIQKLDSGRVLATGKQHTFGRDIESKFVDSRQHLRSRPAIRRYAVKRAVAIFAGVKHPLAVIRLEREVAAMPGDLSGIPAISIHLPNLVAATAVGHEVDRSPVARVTRNTIGSRIARETLGNTALGGHAVHL